MVTTKLNSIGFWQVNRADKSPPPTFTYHSPPPCKSMGLASPGKSSASLSLFWGRVCSEITKRQQETRQKELGPETATYSREEKQLRDLELAEAETEIPVWGGLWGLSLPLVPCENHKQASQLFPLRK